VQNTVLRWIDCQKKIWHSENNLHGRQCPGSSSNVQLYVYEYGFCSLHPTIRCNSILHHKCQVQSTLILCGWINIYIPFNLYIALPSTEGLWKLKIQKSALGYKELKDPTYDFQETIEDINLYECYSSINFDSFTTYHIYTNMSHGGVESYLSTFFNHFYIGKTSHFTQTPRMVRHMLPFNSFVHNPWCSRVPTCSSYDWAMFQEIKVHINNAVQIPSSHLKAMFRLNSNISIKCSKK
jgi:hypothetical protein